ncbi:carbohydrate ABC transporter permease [Planotetraspora kaengkrachanensis]|uniref:ABC transporter permease n=1 Tax=Planotetraspora kaengkrachanensis TaxID=575193 RepID=A0A8J3V9E8_9ACTN|nr:sugar ABC transporter permease [Planotetraspora kaengkrachanensis]GIG82616.1 ABC transporter permease [Planotetraspora kaengkrachanensis]
MAALPKAVSRGGPGALSVGVRRGSRETLVLLAFVLIPFALEMFWTFWPALNSVYISLTQWDGIAPPVFVGLDNYARMWSDETFRTALRNTVIWLVLFGGLSVLGGLGLALLLDKPRKGIGIYRAIFFLPVVFSMVVTALVWRMIFQPDGVVNSILAAVGLEDQARIWLGEPETALYALIVPALWRQVGYIMVLFLAGLKTVDPLLHEAAKMDGASAFERFRHVTLPQLRPITTVVLAVTVIDALRSFDIVWALTKGGPYHSSELLSTYQFSTGLLGSQLGYGSALAVVIFLLTVGTIVVYLVRSLREEEAA